MMTFFPTHLFFSCQLVPAGSEDPLFVCVCVSVQNGAPTPPPPRTQIIDYHGMWGLGNFHTQPYLVLSSKDQITLLGSQVVPIVSSKWCPPPPPPKKKKKKKKVRLPRYLGMGHFQDTAPWKEELITQCPTW